MRVLPFVLAVALAANVSFAARRADADTTALVQSIDGLVKSFDGGAGVWVSDPSAPQPIYTTHPDEQVITASLYKLGVMLHVESLVEQGRLTYGDSITVEDEDITEDGSFEEAGTVLTIDQALESMITLSDNGTALAFWHVYGGQAMNATLQAQKIAGFHIAESVDDDNVASPRAIASYFTALAKRQLVSATASDRMLARLERQQINDRLPALLPEGARVAHKTGNLIGLAHDAGIVHTPRGPRVIVAMTWDAFDDAARSFIAGLGWLVYAAVVEPPTNARFQIARQLSAEAGATFQIRLKVTNATAKPWAVSGDTAVGLVYEIADGRNAVVARSASGAPLPAVRAGQTVDAVLVASAPAQLGDYTVRIGLADAKGDALAPLGAATITTALRVHPAFVVNAVIQIPKTLHEGEGSLVIVQYAPTPAAGVVPHGVALGYRVIDRRTSRTVGSGTVPLGIVEAGKSGTFFSALVAPRLRGSYRIDADLRENGAIASAGSSTTVTIGAPRTYPGDDRRVTPRSSVRRTASPAPR